MKLYLCFLFVFLMFAFSCSKEFLSTHTIRIPCSYKTLCVFVCNPVTFSNTNEITLLTRFWPLKASNNEHVIGRQEGGNPQFDLLIASIKEQIKNDPINSKVRTLFRTNEDEYGGGAATVAPHDGRMPHSLSCLLCNAEIFIGVRWMFPTADLLCKLMEELRAQGFGQDVSDLLLGWDPIDRH